MPDPFEIDKPPTPPSPPPRPSSGPIYAKPCPKCGQLLNSDVVICVRCGHNFSTGAAITTAVVASSVAAATPAAAAVPTAPIQSAAPSAPLNSVSIASPMTEQTMPTEPAGGTPIFPADANAVEPIGLEPPAVAPAASAASPRTASAKVEIKPEAAADSQAGPSGGAVDSDTPLSPDSKFSVQTLGIIGGVILVFAAIVALASPSNLGFWHSVGRGLLTLYQGLIHTGTGMAAVAIAAFMLKRPLGRLDLVAGRMLIAFAAASVLWNIQTPLGVVGDLIMFLVGCGAYWCLIWWFFRRDPRTTNHIAIAHGVLFVIVIAGTHLSVKIGDAGGPRITENMTGQAAGANSTATPAAPAK